MFKRRFSARALVLGCLLSWVINPSMAQLVKPPAKSAIAPQAAADMLRPKQAAAVPVVAPANDTEGASPATALSLDYKNNLASDVFGAHLFSGAFARAGATRFNPEYVIAAGDKIQVQLWGALNFEQMLVVDPQGNIFFPHAGPVRVMGVKNQDLQAVIQAAVAQNFRANVSSYASLAAAQPVKVFVGGFVNRPGLYAGTSTDSLLNYLDQAGGIDPERGSFLRIQVKRGATVRAEVNLYDFLLKGDMPGVQLTEGDVIFVPPRQQVVKISGLVENAKRFEFAAQDATVADLLRVARPLAASTHVRVVRNTGTTKNVEYYPLAQAAAVTVRHGDELELTSDQKIGTITVRVEGEHNSMQEYVLAHGTRVKDLLAHIVYTDRSDQRGLQLFRLSTQKRQQDLLRSALNAFEMVTMSTRSGTSDEARLRKDESDLLQQWLQKAREVVPLGQVVFQQSGEIEDLLLENGDVLKVPVKDGLILISGEVLFPTAIAYNPNYTLHDYIQRAGGYTQRADSERLIVARRDGRFLQVEDDLKGSLGSDDDSRLKEGDQIMVLPKVDPKSRQLWKELTQVIYQIAITARVVLGWI